MHGVGRLEAERGAAGAAERLQQLLDDLVGAVRGPDLPAGEAVAEVVGEVLAQLDGVPVGVAVERARDARDRVRDGLPEALARRVGVLVGVQLDGHVQLGGAVGVQARRSSRMRPRTRSPVLIGLVTGHPLRSSARSSAPGRHGGDVGGEVLGTAEGVDARRDRGQGVAVALDDVDDLEVRVDRQAAGVPGGAAGRQHVVGAGQVVAERDRAVGADEDRAGVADLARHLGGVVGLDLQVLGRPGVGDLARGGEVVDQDVAGLRRPGRSVTRSLVLGERELAGELRVDRVGGRPGRW